ncbi:FemAB family XrtA/PEP-CTERM system-associated protein [Marinimicrobium agarilyticum]|uniref:FemAB family XrtA/PEP-CTERM system-associated protein n=1 Tax=Marinimicrobium agarilyticum TaxID=306546 RepID=UPI00146BAE65|nr:FemAB family XrtA/PEP-CTERM system-associated protein [Marinimicrobium agarilyticum]
MDPASADALPLLELAAEVQAARRELKQQKNSKAKVARDFKAVEKGSSEHQALIDEMQAVSQAFKEAEEQLKNRERVLRAALAALAAPEEAKEPPLFRIPSDQETSESFQVRELTEGEYPAWSDYVRQLQSAPNYCLPEWVGIIEHAFSHPTQIWAAVTDEGKILGGIPLTVFDSRLFGRFAVSMPFFNYGGLLTEYQNVAKALIKRLQAVREREGWQHIEIRTTQEGLDLPVTSRKVSMILPLPKNEVQLDEQLGAKVRAQCKKAEAFRPAVRFGGLELLDDFYRVFAINMRDLGTPVYSKTWFKAILSHPKVEASLVVVYVNGEAVSAGFLLGHNGMLEIPWASTVRSANAMDTNMWMYRQILDYAVQEEYEFFDFGRSTVDAGTYRFKKQWGAKPYPHHWYYLLPEGQELPSINPDNPKYRAVIAVWKRLPLWVTQIVGPPIVKNIP